MSTSNITYYTIGQPFFRGQRIQAHEKLIGELYNFIDSPSTADCRITVLPDTKIDSSSFAIHIDEVD